MTAPKSPDASPETSKHLADEQGFVYDDPNPNNPGDAQPEYEYDPDYVPEREFVLMPLFRRIGAMLGIKPRGEEQEYSLRLASPPQEHLSAPAEPEQIVTNSMQASEEHEFAPAVESSVRPEEDILGMEQGTFSQPTLENELEHGPVFTQHSPLPEPEPVFSQPESEPLVAMHEAQVEPEPVTFEHNQQTELEREPTFTQHSPLPEPQPVFSQPEPEPLVAMHEAQVEPEPVTFKHNQRTELEPEPVAAQAIEDPVSISQKASVEPEVYPITARAERNQSVPPQPVLTQEDIKQLVVPIREAARDAAAKISLAISQAAEWLQSKEEEILRRAQEHRPDRSQWEPTQSPALQREVEWQREHIASQPDESAAQGIPVPQALPKPTLVSKSPAVPFWKRIDWSREFTPRRVAVLGAVAMAMLMVVGVSLARRPASSVLPEQQQTRALQPGGVTLTTHPSVRTAVPARPSPARAASSAIQHQSAPAAPHRAQRRASADDGPDVVTHYYGKPKPSPVHQSTVAGVHHYSDMQ